MAQGSGWRGRVNLDVLFRSFGGLNRRDGNRHFRPVDLLELRQTVRYGQHLAFVWEPRGMSISWWLKQRIDHPRFGRVEHYGRNDWGYHLRINSLDELDEQVQEWLCLAYEVGCQRA